MNVTSVLNVHSVYIKSQDSTRFKWLQKMNRCGIMDWTFLITIKSKKQVVQLNLATYLWHYLIGNVSIIC